TDLESFLERPPVPLPDRPQALFIGVLEPHKNVELLADAWLEVARLRPDATLHVVGTGSRSGEVERLVAELGERATGAHRLDTASVVDAVDASTLLVLPSRSEGLSRVVTEALARGRPVVGSDVAGIADLVQDGVNGLLVPAGDKAALVAALARVLGDRGL